MLSFVIRLEPRDLGRTGADDRQLRRVITERLGATSDRINDVTDLLRLVFDTAALLSLSICVTLLRKSQLEKEVPPVPNLLFVPLTE